MRPEKPHSGDSRAVGALVKAREELESLRSKARRRLEAGRAVGRALHDAASFNGTLWLQGLKHIQRVRMNRMDMNPDDEGRTLPQSRVFCRQFRSRSKSSLRWLFHATESSGCRQLVASLTVSSKVTRPLQPPLLPRTWDELYLLVSVLSARR